MVLAQGDLYRRAGVWRNVAASLVDGVRRAYAGATRGAIPPTREQLTGWLDGLQDSAALPVDTLLTYVRDERILSARELLQLAHECDAIRRHLHRGR